MRIKNLSLRLILCGALAVLPVNGAYAQSFLQKLFGWASSPTPEQTPLKSADRPRSPAQSNEDGGSQDEERYDDAGANGAYRTVCVRMCDGYYFPISSHASSRRFYHDARQCQATCGSDAKLFYLPKNSDDVKNMTDITGRTYGSLSTAFAYRRSLINGCSCKPMPWAAAEVARHDQYALVDSLDKAQQRNAEAERQAAAAKADAELLASMARTGAQQAERAQALSAAKLADAGGDVAVVAQAEVETGSVTPEMSLAHLMPLSMHDAVADDEARSPLVRHTARGLRIPRGAREKPAQLVSWFSWLANPPARRR